LSREPLQKPSLHIKINSKIEHLHRNMMMNPKSNNNANNSIDTSSDCSTASSNSNSVAGEDSKTATVETKSVFQGGVAYPFPWQLHECLSTAEQEGLEHVVSWKSHGRAFSVHKPDEFVKLLMPRFFKQTKFASFQRQLNLYGFLRLHQGEDKGCYYNFCFVRGHQALVRRMVRQKVKGYRVSRASPDEEPNFYLPHWKEQDQKLLNGGRGSSGSNGSLPSYLQQPQHHQSSVMSPSVTSPAVVFVPVPEKAMTSVSMLSSLCRPFALPNQNNLIMMARNINNNTNGSAAISHMKPLNNNSRGLTMPSTFHCPQQQQQQHITNQNSRSGPSAIFGRSFFSANESLATNLSNNENQQHQEKLQSFTFPSPLPTQQQQPPSCEELLCMALGESKQAPAAEQVGLGDGLADWSFLDMEPNEFLEPLPLREDAQPDDLLGDSNALDCSNNTHARSTISQSSHSSANSSNFTLVNAENNIFSL